MGKKMGTPLVVAPGERALDRAGSGVEKGFGGWGAAAAPFTRVLTSDCFFLLLTGIGNLLKTDFGFSLDTAFARLSSSSESFSPDFGATPPVNGIQSSLVSFRFLLLPTRRPCSRKASRVIVLPDDWVGAAPTPNLNPEKHPQAKPMNDKVRNKPRRSWL